MVTSSTEEIVKAQRVLRWGLEISINQTRGEAILDIVLGERDGPSSVVSGLPCIRKNRLQNILYPAVNQLRCPDRRKPANHRRDRRPFLF